MLPIGRVCLLGCCVASALMTFASMAIAQFPGGAGTRSTLPPKDIWVDPTAPFIPLPITFLDPRQQVVVTCAPTSGNYLIITGWGGVPESPTQALRGRAVWQDLRLAETWSNSPATSQSPDRLRVQPALPLSSTSSAQPLTAGLPTETNDALFHRLTCKGQ